METMTRPTSGAAQASRAEEHFGAEAGIEEEAALGNVEKRHGAQREGTQGQGAAMEQGFGGGRRGKVFREPVFIGLRKERRGP